MSRAWVRFEADGEQVAITLEDDGRGCDPVQVAGQGRPYLGVRLTQDVELPTRRLLIRGCGGGSTFTGPSMQTDKVASSLRATPSQILGPMDRLYGEAKLYQSTGGVHTSALSDGHQLLVVASEEIGPTTSS